MEQLFLAEVETLQPVKINEFDPLLKYSNICKVSSKVLHTLGENFVANLNDNQDKDLKYDFEHEKLK